MSIFNIYKPVGLTPLEALEELRRKKPELLVEKLTYAGRLDPLAEGVMLVLSGDDIKRKDEFLNLPKMYEVEILFGISTDTGDVLGLVTTSALPREVSEEEIRSAGAGLVGPRRQSAPVFSSPGLDGKKFQKEVEVYNVIVTGSRPVSATELLTDILQRVSQVSGNFRQVAIADCWRKELSGIKQSFALATVEISSSSGTYMRLLAAELGAKLGLPALAYRIKRSKVGEYKEADALSL